MKKSLQKQKGFTLIEVLIAMTIFAIGLLAIAEMQITAIHANSKSNTLTVATALAEQALEDQLSRASTDPFYRQATTSPQTYDLDPGSTATTLTINGAGTYSATYTVTPCTTPATSPMLNVTTITVTVTKVTATNGKRTVTLTGFKRAI